MDRKSQKIGHFVIYSLLWDHIAAGKRVMEKLNLPEYDFNIKRRDNKLMIFDDLRKKYLVLSPEEWVRQNFIRYLVEELKYPKSLIKAEGGMNYNQLKKRTDIVFLYLYHKSILFHNQ